MNTLKEMEFPQLTMTVGGVLIVLGVLSYILSGAASVTALIPAFLGIPIAAAGYFGQQPDYRKAAMHVAVALAALGVLGSLRVVVILIDVIGGEDFDNPLAVIAQILMIFILGGYLYLAIQSFIRARQNQDTPATEA